jgi:hypothetical protein
MNVKACCSGLFWLTLAIGCQSRMNEQTSFTETSIRVDANGLRHVVTTRVTGAQIAAENDTRRRAGELERRGIEFAQDVGCADTSLWIFDQANQAGNKICFSGPGTDVLEPYCDEINFDCVPWDYQAASVWGATTHSGQIDTYPSGCTTVTSFAANEQKNIACVHNSYSATQF